MILENIAGLWALAAIIPFIIIYLRRPKAQDQTIPSLMFLLQQRKTSTKYSFFKRLFRNPLIIIQLLALLGMIFAITSPLITLPWGATSGNTVIVVDVSGSMQTKHGASTRFAQALADAQKQLSGRVSIILAENSPLILLREGSKSEAIALLTKLKPKATSTNLGAALLTAADILEDKKGKVIVLSDFLNTEGPDFLVAMREIASKGNAISSVNLAGKVGNIGIIELNIKKDLTTVFVKNFNDKKETIKLRLSFDDEQSEKSLSLLPNSIESVQFPTPGGVSTIELSPKDDFGLDDKVFISAPEKNRLNVLLITNRKSSSIIAALQAMNDVELDIVNPPVLTLNIKEEKINPYESDIIFVDGINNVQEKGCKEECLLPGTFRDIKDFVEHGKSLVLMVQGDSKDIDTQGLSPVGFKELVADETSVRIDQPDNQFTTHLDLNRVAKYYNAIAQGSEIIASSMKDNATLIALKNLGEGKVFYYGIFDERADFKTSPSYPIFWNELLRFLAESEDIAGYNYKTGGLVAIDEQDVKTPSDTLTTSKILLDEQGIYHFNDRDVAVNMLNQDESDVGGESKIYSEGKEFESSKYKKKIDTNIEFYLVLFVLMIMLFEIFYIKRRGDI